MLLAVDVGNTNITFAVFKDEEVVASFRITTKNPRTPDEFCMTITNLLQIHGVSRTEIDAVIVASVVPGIMYSLNSALYECTGLHAMQIGVGTKTGLKLKSANPKEIGADRVVDAVAAYEIYGGPVLVADFGTATTYDLILEDGTFDIGITCPGLRMSANALWNETAKLPEVEIKLPNTILAKDTITSMQAGLVFGCIGQTEYIINRVKKESGLDNITVVATGGLGKIIADATDTIDIYDHMLTMKGLRLIYNKNSNQKYDKR